MHSEGKRELPCWGRIWALMDILSMPCLRWLQQILVNSLTPKGFQIKRNKVFCKYTKDYVKQSNQSIFVKRTGNRGSGTGADVLDFARCSTWLNVAICSAVRIAVKSLLLARMLEFLLDTPPAWVNNVTFTGLTFTLFKGLASCQRGTYSSVCSVSLPHAEQIFPESPCCHLPEVVSR